jgi:hypothetical protein
MADTGYNWDAGWTAIDAAIVLTQGGTTTDNSATIDLDGKAACLISIDTDYSNHAKATGGLFVYIVREAGDGSFEAEADGPWGFEMPFTQAGTNRVVFALSAADFNKFQIHLDWDNSTASSVATTKTDIKYATVPVAS